MTLNTNKTELVIFRRGGRIAEEDYILCKGQRLKTSNSYNYLGITMQTTGTTFTIHLREKIAAAVRCISDIKHLSLLSIETAMKLFEAKVVPTATYGIDLIWEHLTKKNSKNWKA